MAVRLTNEDRAHLERLGNRLGVGKTTLARVAMRLGVELLDETLKERRALAEAVLARLAPIQGDDG